MCGLIYGSDVRRLGVVFLYGRNDRAHISGLIDGPTGISYRERSIVPIPTTPCVDYIWPIHIPVGSKFSPIR